jgi:hypothetical protein
MSAYKVVRDSAGRCRGCGPNDGNYEPAIPVGGSLSLSETFVQIELSPEESSELARQQAVDEAIQSDSTVSALKAMTNAEFDTWWAANVTNAAQAINVLKRVTRVVIRRVL